MYLKLQTKGFGVLDSCICSSNLTNRDIETFVSGKRNFEDNIYTSLESLNVTASSERFPYKSKPSRHNPNVLFRRPNDMPIGILY